MVAISSRRAGLEVLRKVALATVAVVIVSLLAPVGRAEADPACPGGQTAVQTTSGVICVVVTDPGGGGGAGDPGSPGNGGGGAQQPVGCFKTDGTEVPCVTDLGAWWSGHQCYAAPYDAPPGSPAWQGHTDGSVWECTACTGTGNAGACTVQILWLAPGQEPGPPDPAQLATTAVGLMTLATATVHTAPQAPRHSYVGVENWLWVPPEQWATLSKTVTAGGTAVTVKAAPARVAWDLGAGSRTCDTPGEVWHEGMSDGARTSCGYTYTSTSDSQPHGVYRITAAITYDVTWTCVGACTTDAGSLGPIEAPAGKGSLRVLQRQTVIVR